MRAVGVNSFGGPEVLEVVELPIPAPGPGELRIKVAAATVNPTDVGLRSGNSAAALSAFPAPYVPGMELAGVVDAVGADVPFSPGDDVMAIMFPQRTGRGAQAEYVVVPASAVARAPAGKSLVEAATIPMNGLTVRRALDLLDPAPGDSLLVTGAAGAVGAYAVQLGAFAGLRVAAVAGDEDRALVTSLGASDFFPRGDDLVERVRHEFPNGVDGVVDAAVLGSAILGAVRDGGSIAAVRAFDGESERGITIHQVRVSDYADRQADLDMLGRLAERDQLALRVAETYPPERAGEAQARLTAGGVRGRLVIVF